MNELSLDLEMAAPWVARAPRRVPPAVGDFWCRPTRAGGLMFAWKHVPGRFPRDTYWLERTRDGRDFELLAETSADSTSLPPVDLNEAWFYRVTAVNARGQGPSRWVYFFLRRPQRSVFLRVASRPGLRVVISELVRE